MERRVAAGGTQTYLHHPTRYQTKSCMHGLRPESETVNTSTRCTLAKPLIVHRLYFNLSHSTQLLSTAGSRARVRGAGMMQKDEV